MDGPFVLFLDDAMARSFVSIGFSQYLANDSSRLGQRIGAQHPFPNEDGPTSSTSSMPWRITLVPRKNPFNGLYMEKEESPSAFRLLPALDDDMADDNPRPWDVKLDLGTTTIDVTGGNEAAVNGVGAAVIVPPPSNDDDDDDADHGRRTLTHDRARRSQTRTLPSSEPLARRVVCIPPPRPPRPWSSSS